MGLKGFPRVGGLFLVIVVAFAKSQEDSLRSALNAVDRRQKDLSEFARYDDDIDNVGEYGYSLEGPGDLAFLTPSDYNTDPALERLVLDYLEEPESNREDDANKRISSSFRERLEEDKERQVDELARSFLANNEDIDADDYNEIVRELWEKYRNYPEYYSNRPRSYPEELKKRSYYPRFGLDGAGLRKRSRYNYDESRYMNRYLDESDIDNYLEQPRHFRRERKYNYQKRFPVAKRSSNYKSEMTHEHKRSTKKESAIKTDPKVAKELSRIFGDITTQKPTTGKQTDKPTKPMKNLKKEPKVKSNKTEKSSKPLNNNKEVVGGIVGEKPLQIKKKSIDWSDYFGLDRRKKSEDNNDLDDEWVMERYHKAVAMTTKRNAEYPLQSFKNHDLPAKDDKKVDYEKKEFSPEEAKIEEMDEKLKNMEETIIDDAIKYTGAHEGITDSKEVQEVKDKVISRLAAAYSLEKMRRALGEYKLSVEKERERLKQQRKYNNDNSNDDEFFEEKRVSVPRKQAVDEDREKIPEGDNNIKCSQGDEDCDDQNYRIPTEIIAQATFEACPKVQRACDEYATVMGHYARVFEQACNMHQMCLICSNNSWFAPTRRCNVLFMTKALELCDGKPECQKEARRSVRYLLEVNQPLRLESSGECDMFCPDRRYLN